VLSSSRTTHQRACVARDAKNRVTMRRSIFLKGGIEGWM
jgi:hypothetical protein